MSSTGTTTSMSSGLRTPASTMVTGPGLAGGAVVAAEEAGDLVERALGGRQADALDGPVGDGVEALEGERQVGAALGGGQGVDLVDDHGLDAPQGLAGRRGEHQVERLGRGDEQVGRVAQHAPALVGRGVAGAHAHDRRVERARRGARRPGRCRRAGPAGSSRRRRRGPAAARRRAAGCGARGPRAAGSETSRSRPQRKAASVLPEPVGASTSVCSPEAMAGQPWACGGVASAKVVENQARTGAEKRSSGSGAVTPWRLPTCERSFTRSLPAAGRRRLPDSWHRISRGNGIRPSRSTARPSSSCARTTSRSSRPASPSASRSRARPCPR